MNPQPLRHRLPFAEPMPSLYRSMPTALRDPLGSNFFLCGLCVKYEQLTSPVMSMLSADDGSVSVIE